MKVRGTVLVLLLGALLLSSAACGGGSEEVTPTSASSPTETPYGTATPTQTPTATPTPHGGPEDFQINEWSVIDDNGTAAIQARITASSDYSLTLTGPEGIHRDSGSGTKGTSEIKLTLLAPWKVPSPGQYTLLVEDTSGKEIATQTFDLEGMDLVVSGVSCTWEINVTGSEYTLTDFEFTAANNGDVPAYIEKALITARGRTGSVPLQRVVLPGTKQAMSDSTRKPYTRYITGVAVGGERAMEMKLLDGSRQIVWASKDIDPSLAKQLDFQLDEWSIIDDEGTPALQALITTDDAVNLTIVDPAETERDWLFSNAGTNEVKLLLGSEGEVPEAGPYTLIVKDAWGNEATTQNLALQGVDLAVSSVIADWSERSSRFHLQDIQFNVSNRGDVPAYIWRTDLTVHGQSGLIEEEQTVLPGGEAAISKGATTWWGLLGMNGIWGGERTLTLTFEDSMGKVIDTHSEIIAVP